MSRAQAESVIKNIIKEIAQECTIKGQPTSETLVAFMVKAVVLDPDNGFNVERTLTKDDVAKLIQMCVFRLLERNAPSLNTIQMQVYFDMNYTTQEDFLAEHQKVLEQRLSPVIREISDSRARTREELEVLYTRIVSYVLLRSGLGSPTDINVVREATAALQSVFPQSELGHFMSLLKRDKERQLVELALIVSGIRLFNRDCGKGGEGIDNLPAVLNEAFPSSLENIEEQLKFTGEKACLYTEVLEAACLKQDFPPPLDWPKLKDALYNARQHQHFLNILKSDMKVCEQEVGNLMERFLGQMESVKATVSSKTAVPTAEVYPQFIGLAQVWARFQDQVVLLSVLSNIQVNLGQFSRTHLNIFSDENVLAPYIANRKIKSDQERLEKTNGKSHRINAAKIVDKRFTVLFPESTKNFKSLSFHMKGFCPMTFHTYNGLLIPSNPNIGVVVYDGINYAFSSAEAAYDFTSEPEYYIRGVADVAKKSPELIQLLELHKQFDSIEPSSAGVAAALIKTPVTKCDVGMQTELHPIETNIVKSYEWNEWELRRKAIKLTNLRQRITHSTQTSLSHYRRENNTQVFLPKFVETQTKRESGSKVPKPTVFVAGLRGCPTTRTDMTKVDLTRDVNDV